MCATASDGHEMIDGDHPFSESTPAVNATLPRTHDCEDTDWSDETLTHLRSPTVTPIQIPIGVLSLVGFHPSNARSLMSRIVGPRFDPVVLGPFLSSPRFCLRFAL